MNFNLHVPDDRYDFSKINLPPANSLDRLKQIIHEMIRSSGKGIEYELCDEVFNYGVGNFEAGTRYGLNFHQSNQVCVIFSTQRDVAYPLALFPLNRASEAADYFVWLVAR